MNMTNTETSNAPAGAPFAFRAAVLLVTVGLCATAGHAQTADQPTTAAVAPAIIPATTLVAEAPADPAASAETKLNIFIRVIEGRAAFIRAGEKTAYVAKVGDMIEEGTEIMTSAAGLVRVQVGSGQMITVDRGSRVAVRTAISRAGKETTRIEVPLGRIGFDVQRVAGDNDVEIKAPDATLAVKGTTGFMEVTAGQPTVAAGGDLNTGQFNMLYNTGKAARVTTSKKTNSNRITTEKTEQANLFVEVADGKARSGDEEDFAAEHTNQPQTLASDLTKVTDKRFTYANGASYYEGTIDGNILAKMDLTGVAFSQSGGYSGFSASPIAGTLSRDKAGRTVILTVENVGGFEGSTGSGAPMPVIRQLVLRRGSFVYETVASFAEVGNFGRTSWEFSGLASMGGALYAAGKTYTAFGTKDQQVESGQIYEVLGINGRVPNPVMNLGIDLQRGLAGDNRRGSLFVFGSLPGTTFGFEGAANAILLQVDPRNNLVQNGWSTITGQFANRNGSLLSSMTAITGVSMVGNVLVVTGTNRTGQSVRATVTPFAGAGRVTGGSLINDGGGARVAYSANAAATAPAPGNLRPEGGTLPARDDINSLFSDLAFTMAARQSGVIEQIVRAQVLNTAFDRQAALASGDLSIISAILGQSTYDNQRAGVGLTVAEFRRRVLLSGDRRSLPPSMYYNGGG